MKTVVIRMDDLPKGENTARVYPVQLFFDDGAEGWLERPLAKINIPEDLSVPNPPDDPISKKPIDGREIREAFIKETGESARFSRWGTYLHQLLFQEPLAKEWKRLRGLYPGEIPDKSEGLRAILDIQSDTLRWLPWELLVEPPEAPLFFDPANPFSRGALDKELDVKTFTWPIHVLIVVGSKETDEKINAQQELEAIQNAFIKSPLPIDWYVCCRPTKAELIELIAKYKPQIFHFIGHGEESAGGYSFLELNDKKGGPTPDEWSDEEIIIDLKPWQPRFAFLNACRTSSTDMQENSWDLARAFAKAGVPAVLGMQADIKGDAAAEFSRKLYLSMLQGTPLDRALAEARAAVKTQSSIRQRDWALATLYLQQLPEQILGMTPPIDKEKSEKFKADGRLKKTNDFVGRLKQRRRLWHGVDQVIDREEEFNSAFIVVGNDQMGKTSLVQASLRVCALRQRQISYVDIGYESTKDFLDILEAIRKGDPESSDIICAPLPDEPFAYFDEKFNYLKLLTKTEALTQLAADSNLCEQFFNAYKDALIAIAVKEPLILVLDHLNVEWKTFNSVLVKYLLAPIAKDQLPRCRLVVACSVEDFEKRLSQDLIDAAQVVSVGAWKPEKYVPLMRQICLYNDIKLDTEVESTILAMSKLVTSDWGPTQLRGLLAPIKQARGMK